MYDGLKPFIKKRFASSESSFCTLTAPTNGIQQISERLASINISDPQGIDTPNRTNSTLVLQGKCPVPPRLEPFACVTPNSRTPVEIKDKDGSTFLRISKLTVTCTNSQLSESISGDQSNSNGHIEKTNGISYTVATYCKVALHGTKGDQHMLLTPTKVKHIKQLPIAMEQLSLLATTEITQNFVVPADPKPLEKRGKTQQQIMGGSAKNAAFEVIGDIIKTNELKVDVKIDQDSIEALKWLIAGNSKINWNVAEYDFKQEHPAGENRLVKKDKQEHPTCGNRSVPKEWTHLRSFRNGGNKYSQNQGNLVGDTAANNTWELVGEIVVSELAKAQKADLNMKVSALCLPERHISCKKFWVIDNPETQKIVDIQFISGMPLPPSGISLEIFWACLSRGLLNTSEL